MGEINVKFNKESPQNINERINIIVDNTHKGKFLYKYLISRNGKWRTLKDFSKINKVQWIPNENGKYIIQVQAKEENSSKCVDYTYNTDYLIGEANNEIIKNVYINKKKVKVGEKITIIVESNSLNILYKYWIKKDNRWTLIKNYSMENILNFTAVEQGNYEILIQCKKVNSKEKFDEFKIMKIEVSEIDKVKIKDFICLNKEIVKDSEIIFKIDADFNKDRTILYKFIKIDENGNYKCIQDYSTNKTVSYMESKSGNYKMLCMVKDMYSSEEYDDRALIFYNVKKYPEIKLESFTADLSSPQPCGETIELKAIAKGGKDLRYRFKISGNNKIEDSGYIKSNTYTWNAKEHGNYKLEVLVKDKSCNEKYEDKKSLDFEIQKIIVKDIKIDGIVYEEKEIYLKDETINLDVKASGSINLLYSFIVYKDDEIIQKIDYGEYNWINLTPKKNGNYKIDIRVKDKYSMREYDAHEVITFIVKDFIPAKIDYIIVDSKDYITIGDKIIIDLITQNTKDTLIKYILKIDGILVEQTEFINDKRYTIVPKAQGFYEIDIFAKNKDSKDEFDNKKTVKFYVNSYLPVTETKIKLDKIDIKVNETITALVESKGGFDVIYEFYLMQQEEWVLVQRYSKKNYYSFIPFIKGKYKILVLSKSLNNKKAYEDYNIIEFNVE